jgi:hypothetical protein
MTRNPLAMIVIGALMLVFCAIYWFRAVESREWQAAQATIGRSSRRRIYYVYTANGVNHQGRNVVVAPVRVRLLEPPIQRTRNIVQVYFDPKHPQRAVIYPGISVSLVAQTVGAAVVLAGGFVRLKQR